MLVTGEGVNGAGSSAAGIGDTLTLMLNITFQSPLRRQSRGVGGRPRRS